MITSVQITNIGRFDSLELKGLGAVNLIDGNNGEGKSTILETIMAVFEGGHRPYLIREGSERGRIVINLSNGTKIDKVVSATASRSSIKVTTADGVEVPSPQTYLKTLADGFALRPTGLIDCKPSERIEYLLDALPITFERAELVAAIETDYLNDGGVANLAFVDGLIAGYRSRRTDENRTVRDLQGMRNQAAAALPPVEDDAVNWSARAAEKLDALDDAKSSMRDVHTALKSQADDLRLKEREAAQESINAINAILAARLLEIDMSLQEKLQKLTEPLQATIERLSGEAVEARTKADEQLRALGAREELRKFDDQLTARSKSVVFLDRVIEKLEKLRKRKLDGTVLDGIEIRDGRIFVNGLDFDTQLNTSEQYLVSFRVATLKLGELPVMVCDRAESLNDEKLDALTEAVKGAGLQLFITRMRAGEPLTVSVKA